MNKISAALKKRREKKQEQKEQSAQEAVLQDLFQDMYRERKKIYKVNFFRGIFFGLGTFLGGTLMVAFVVWLLSFFVQIPVIGDYFHDAQQTIEQGKPSR